MTSHSSRRRYRKTSGRRVWVFSELNHELRPEQVARIITSAGLEQARLEAEAQAEREHDLEVSVRDLQSADAEQGGGDA